MKDRADKVLTDLGLVSSRSQAKTLIEKGEISVNGKLLRKAGDLISASDDIKVHSPQFVGRGAFKLLHALTEFKVNCADLVFLDVGASTGGFTEVLLNHGAKRVFAIDVGHDQLAAKLRQDPRVINMEGTNIREIENLPELADAAVMDLSFISITKVLADVRRLLKKQSWLIVLIKPQFEAGKERLPKDGVIKDAKVQEEILKEVLGFARADGWKVEKTIDSPIEGKAGNREFLALFKLV